MINKNRNDRKEYIESLIDLISKSPDRKFFVLLLSKSELDTLKSDSRIIKIEEAENPGMLIDENSVYCKVYVQKQKEKSLSDSQEDSFER